MHSFITPILLGSSIALASHEASEVDACALLSDDRIEEVTGTRPKATKPNDAGVVAICMWTVDDPYPDYPIVSVIVTPQPQTTWDGFIDNLIAGEMQEIVSSGERVDIGRFGLYDERMLIVATPGGSTVMLSVTPPFREETGRDGMMALAHMVLDRLP